MRIHFHSFHGSQHGGPVPFQHMAEKLLPPRLYHAYAGSGEDGLVALALLLLLGVRMLWRASGALAARFKG